MTLVVLPGHRGFEAEDPGQTDCTCPICDTCSNTLQDKKKRREHLVGHYYAGHTEILHQELCGFCGLAGACDTNLQRTGSASFKMDSNCRFFEKFSLGSVGIYKKSGSSTRMENYPNKCTLCEASHCVEV
jgi:hypothetical protein